MEIIKSEKGKSKGRINVVRTLVTLKKKERWETCSSEVSANYVRECASKLAKSTGREYSVSHTAEMGDKIVITRTA